MAIVAVDFDGTICEHKFPDIGELKPYCKEVMNLLKEAGHEIIIWTCRCDDEHGPYKTKMKEWLDKNEIPYDKINENVISEFQPIPKIYFDVCIDDRNLFMHNSIDWIIIEAELKKIGIL